MDGLSDDYARYCLDGYLSHRQSLLLSGFFHQPTELHVRHNLNGDVEIRDGEAYGDGIRVDIESIIPNDVECKNIIPHHSTHQLLQQSALESLNVILLQLDCEPTMATVDYRIRIWLNLVSALVPIMLVVFLVALWRYRRRRRLSESGSERRDADQSTNDRGRMSVERQIPSDLAAVGRTSKKRNESSKWNGVQSLFYASPSTLPQPPSHDQIYVLPSGNNKCGEGVDSGAPTGRNSFSSSTPGGAGSRRTLLASLSVVFVVSIALATNDGVELICPEVPTARVFISVPLNYKLSSLKLFFNQNFSNVVNLENWSEQNRTSVQIFDVKDAGYTEKPPCSADVECQDTDQQNSAGCDPATGKCVCQRGFAKDDEDRCIDVETCSPGRSRCATENEICHDFVRSDSCKCHDVIRSDSCQCHDEYFADGIECKACSGDCPAGTYQSVPCYRHADRICRAVAMYPDSATDDDADILIIEGLSVETSENVFLEDLSNTRNLETTYYVTDTTQASDFYWDRESGLRVNIGIHNVHLLPEYQDVNHEHDGDNKYMLKNPNDSADKNSYQRVMHDFCRHPVPDYYSITLEVARNRTTATENLVCNSDSSSSSSSSSSTHRSICPDDQQREANGDFYLHRTLNDRCMKSDNVAEILHPAANSVVCVDNSSLLSAVFNQTYRKDRPINFPPKRCISAQKRCQSCLNQQKCQQLDEMDRKCCQTECYSLADCKIASSKDCSSSEVECATGDAYRYTIQPVFRNIHKEFRCHVSHRSEPVLYELFVFIQIPQLGFQTPRSSRIVYNRDLAFQKRGQFQADFLNVEHSVEFDMHEELVIHGREEKPGRMEYNITPAVLTKSKEERNDVIPIHSIASNIWVATTQFDRPFAYSTSTWINNNNCQKNVSKLLSARPSTDNRDDKRQQRVTAFVQKTGEQFSYSIKSYDNPPYFRFTVPANASILPYYHREFGGTLVTDDSLTASLNMSSGRVWRIFITGKMSNCPSYLGITVRDRLTSAEMCRYDLLVFCPTIFNVTIKIPSVDTPSPTTTFQVLLRDSRKNFSIFLTQMTFDDRQPSATSDKIAVWDRKRDMDDDLPLAIVIVGTASVLFMLAFLVCYVYVEHAYKRDSLLKQKYPAGVVDVDGEMYTYPERLHSEGTSARKMNLATWVLVLARTAYSLAFNLTAVSSFIRILTRPEMERLNEIDNFRLQQINATSRIYLMVNEFSDRELLRQNREADGQMFACNNYSSNILSKLSVKMRTAVYPDKSSTGFGNLPPISSFLSSRIQKHLDKFSVILSDYHDAYQTKVVESLRFPIRQYQRYLEKALQGDNWYIFARNLFNASRRGSPIDSGKPARANDFPGFHTPTDSLIDFGLFIEIEEIEEVGLWPETFWNRFNWSYPAIPPISTIDVSSKVFHCQMEDQASYPTNASAQTEYHHIDSFRFFTTYPPDAETLSSIHSSSDAKSRTTAENNSLSYFHIVEIFDEIVFTHSAFIICAILDVAIFIYRANQTYANAALLQASIAVGSPRAGRRISPQNNLLGNGVSSLPHPTSNSGNHYCYQIGHTGSDMDSYPDESHPHGGNFTNASDKRSWRLSHNHQSLICSVPALLLRSRELPKTLLALTLLAFLRFAFRSLHEFLDPEKLIELNVFGGAFVDQLAFHIHLTNTFISEQSKDINGVSTNTFQDHLLRELRSLQGLTTYFNSEQQKIARQYISQVCSDGSQDSSICRTEVPQIVMPILPCNFVPVQPHLYNEYNEAAYVGRLVGSLKRYTDAVRSLLATVECVVFVTVSTVIIAHFALTTLYCCLRMKLKLAKSKNLEELISRADPTPSVPSMTCGKDGFVTVDGRTYDQLSQSPTTPLSTSNALFASESIASRLERVYSETKV